MTDNKQAGNNNLTVRVSDAGVAWVKEVMKIRDTTQSVVMRALFSVATHHPDEVDAKIVQFKDSTAPAALPEEAAK